MAGSRSRGKRPKSLSLKALYAPSKPRVKSGRGRALSVNRLVDFSGVGRGHLSGILAGKSSPTLRTVGRLAATLGVAAKDLLPENEPSRAS